MVKGFRDGRMASTVKDVTEGRPLVVDLDGTLIASDLLVEGAFGLVGSQPAKAVGVMGALLKGKAELKHFVAQHGAFDPTSLPYDASVLDLIRSAREEGRPVYLATASHETYAHAIATHLELFDGVFATSRSHNLSGSNKAAALVERFGDGGFDYVGNHADDLAIWKHATAAYAIRTTSGVRRKLRRLGVDVHEMHSPRATFKVWLKALRVHQYTKNLLVFAPVAASHTLDPGKWLATVLAFISFSLAASATYLLNDLVDIDADRRHATKRFRPFASGTLSLQAGIVAVPVLFGLALAIALSISPLYTLVLAGYVVLTTSYSFYLKRKLLVDVVSLAMLYTVRVLAGGVAAGVTLSEWLLALSLFVFSSLALIKRYTEIASILDRNLPDPTNRNYRKDDLVVLAALAAATGTNAVTVFAMYVSSPVVMEMYTRPKLLWLLCPLLLYLLGRALMMSHRREMHDDPVVWALRDRICRLGMITAGIIVLCAI
jgi:4-hydroxybenzoate polyprenyltransferase/phosphoserine phosphatase